MNRTPRTNGGEKVGLISAISIGIGGMVGGAIFAVLGLSASLAKGAMPIAFLVGGAVALSTSYSYAKLSVAFPSRGGTVAFIDKAFGHGLLSGGLNNLLLLSYVVVLSLYAYAFGGYGASFFDQAAREDVKHGLISAAIIGLTILNVLEAKAVLKTENTINALKLIILGVFVVAALVAGPDMARMAPSEWVSPLEIVAGGMIIFVNYEGFELISNASPDVPDRARILPRAHYISVLIVVGLYILIAIASLGVMSAADLAGASDYALAAAAKRVLGSPGFVLIAVAALLATASAINATFYCTGKLTYTMAAEGEAPQFLERLFLNQPVAGLLMVSVLTLFIANFFNLNAISTMASSGFLLIFAAVNWANLKLARQTNSRRWISGTALGLCLIALVAIAIQVALNPATRSHLLILAAMLAISFGAEWLYQKRAKRTR